MKKENEDDGKDGDYDLSSSFSEDSDASSDSLFANLNPKKVTSTRKAKT